MKHLILATRVTVLLLIAAPLHAQTTGRGLRAARTLARGDSLTAADIVADSGVTDNPALLVGLVTRRVINSGELLRPPGIGKPIAIHAGETVTVRAIAGGVIVSRLGVAMFDAGFGDSVRVRLDMRTAVLGVVRDKSTVVLQ